jgi:hypothetical protein
MDYLSNRSALQQSSFSGVPQEDLDRFLSVSHYGDFELTEAIRPAYDLRILPQQGYRIDMYMDKQRMRKIPVLMAAVTRAQLFQVFMDLTDHFSDVVDVVLETRHHSPNEKHTDLYREHIDRPVLQSTLWGYEDLLTNDGDTGIAVVNQAIQEEVQFDEHKLLSVYADQLSRYEAVLRQYRIAYRAQMRFIAEDEHMHTSSEEYYEQFQALRAQLGLDT